jgi:hypothetical protein
VCRNAIPVNPSCSEEFASGEIQPLPNIGRMTQIILNDDQVQTVRKATDTVVLCDQSGVLLGVVTQKVMASPEEIAEARRRLNSDGPWYTTAEMLARLHASEQP